jgi:hypothetical protein
MNPNDVNVLMLESVAQRLGDDLLGELVFVGGAVAGLLVTDPAMPAIRQTEDVDLLVQACKARETQNHLCKATPDNSLHERFCGYHSGHKV